MLKKYLHWRPLVSLLFSLGLASSLLLVILCNASPRETQAQVMRGIKAIAYGDSDPNGSRWRKNPIGSAATSFSPREYSLGEDSIHPLS